jgi:hypothetical protein
MQGFLQVLCPNPLVLQVYFDETGNHSDIDQIIIVKKKEVDTSQVEN